MTLATKVDSLFFKEKNSSRVLSNFKQTYFMLWRKFNGESIKLPIKDAVEDAIRRETSSWQ